MSIPKEPRQLMINLMYLVLTALLALNVSAEIINAFFMIDRGLKASNNIVDQANNGVQQAIDKQAEGYPQFKPLAQKASDTRKIAKELITYIDEIRERVIEGAGGYKLDKETGEPTDMPVRKKDKDVTTRLLVEGGVGDSLEAKILETRQAFINLFDEKERETKAESIPLKIENTYKDSDKSTWSQFTFQQMPVASVLPIFSKIQNDVKTSETTILNELLGKTGVDEVKFDAFQPVVSANKAYVIKGEKYEAEVFLSAYSKSANNVSISIDGKRRTVKEGKAKYTATPSSIGSKKYNVSISVKNPVSGKTETFKKSFEYEVGERSVAVSADMMNVFYIGVKNPISVSAAGIPSSSIKVSTGGSGGASVNKINNNQYNVKVTRPTKKGEFCKINVSGQGMNDSKQFRVKRIPDPVAKLGKESSGAMRTGEFKAQGGIRAVLENFDFDARCNIQGFMLTRVAKRQDPVDAPNKSGKYSDRAQRLVNAAKPGDIYYFDNIKARCPGDIAGRKINSMVFKIK